MLFFQPTYTLRKFGPSLQNVHLPAPGPSTTPLPPPSWEPFLQTKQSGQVTPGHLAAWATDNVLIDAGVQFNNTFGKFVTTSVAVNFNNTNTDYPLNINLPAGYTRYRIEQVLISGASIGINVATVGMFTGLNGSGNAIVSSGTAISISQIANDISGNLQSLTVNNQNTTVFGDFIVYFRVQNPQGSAATANVSVFYQPVP
jgi:hypothetical protein